MPTATAYSNGFCLSKVTAALFGRVGWMQPAGDESPVVNEANQQSRGGRYFNDGSFHALCTLANLKAVMEQPDATDEDLNDYIEQLQKSIILRALNGVFSQPEYISQGLLFRTNRFNNTTIENDGNFVGVRFKIPDVVDIATQLDSVSLYFDADATFNLYLFHETTKDHIWSQEVTVEANTQKVIDLDGVVLNHIGPSNLGGAFYFGYFQSELSGAKAIREQDIIVSCNSPYGFSFFQSPASGGNFDRSQFVCGSSPYGINLHVSCFRDHSWQIVKKASLFDNVIGLQMAAQVVEQIMFSIRSNGSERNLKEQVGVMGMMELDGSAPISDGPTTTGLRKQITQELQRLRNSFFTQPKAQNVSLC